MIKNITLATSQQAQEIANINSGLGQIDSVTQMNAGNARQAAESSGILLEDAARLQEALAFFKVRQ